MGQKLKELKLVSFMRKHNAEIDLLQKTFVDLFNKCGQIYDDNSMQLALMGGLISMFCKNSKIPKKEIEKLLENISKKLK